jgi:hypothetical protein
MILTNFKLPFQIINLHCGADVGRRWMAVKHPLLMVKTIWEKEQKYQKI